MPSPQSGDLVILVRPQGAEKLYNNKWAGDRLDVLATHQTVVNAINKARAAGRERVFVQLSPGGRVIGSATIGTIEGRGTSIEVPFTDWMPMDDTPAGRSFGNSFYWVK